MRIERDMGASITGTAVAAVRKALALEPYGFSVLMGVHISSVYRWEKSSVIRADALQRDVLDGLRRFVKNNPPSAARELGGKVERALIAARPLLALRYVLEVIEPGGSD